MSRPDCSSRRPKVGGKADFTYMPGRNHFDLYQDGLAERIAKEMYSVARLRRGSTNP